MVENCNDIKYYQIPVWSLSKAPDYDIVVDSNATLKQSSFRYDPVLNDKISIWCGQILTLDTDAIVNVTNETLDEKTSQSDALLRAAGPDLKRELMNNIRRCKTGDAKITKGYLLPTKYIIHTVGPRYNVHYKTAAENALYSCYRNILRLAYENKLTSLAVCCVHSARRGYPPFEAAHIAIRTVRRFLEKYGENFERIIFVVNPEEEEVYSSFLPLYFPRNLTEEQYMAYQLPQDVGNIDGEPVIEERQIKIVDLPKAKVSENADNHCSESTLNASVIKEHPFLKMEEDIDVIRHKQHHFTEKHEINENNNVQKRYETFVKHTRREDLSSLATLRCLYLSGVDRYLRPVVVFISKNCSFKALDTEKLLKYFVRIMDDVVKSSYVIVYVNTMASADNQLNLSFLRLLIDVTDERYRRNLGALYILHPTFPCKSTFWLFTSFVASDLKSKVHHIRGLEYLYKRISPDQIDLPEFVIDYDQKTNGVRYYTEEEDYSIEKL